MSNGVSERGFCCCYSKLLSLGLSKLKGCWAKLLLGWWWESGTGSDVSGDCLYCSTAEEHLLQEVTVWSGNQQLIRIIFSSAALPSFCVW